VNNQPGFGVSGGDWRIHAELNAELIAEAVKHVGVDPGHASSFSTGDASERNTFVHPNATFSPNDCMIDAKSSSFDPINRYTVPVPSPAADAMSLIVVTS